MKFLRHKLSFALLPIILLPILLGVLATLQYVWLTQISAAERERLESRLKTDVLRFANDFNSEITKAYFAFQLDANVLENPRLLAERRDLWLTQAAFPQIVGEVFLVRKTLENDFDLQRFDSASRRLESAEWTSELLPLREKVKMQTNGETAETPPAQFFSFDSIDENAPAIIIPIHQIPDNASPANKELKFKTSFDTSKNFVIVKLDSEAIKKQMLPELARRHFPEINGANYHLTIVNRKEPDKIIFQSQNNQTTDSSDGDAATGIFDLTPETSNILILNGSLPRVRAGSARVFEQRLTREEKTIKSDDAPLSTGETRKIGVKIVRNGERTETVVERKSSGESGRWLLTVRHADGSLENFVNKTRNRNLAVSFGILFLLGASVVLLVASAQSAKCAAGRQIDFVSSVSHEFRTPIAVICSASDNLADGIIQTQPQIEKYGKLIRRESQRLAEMVEQILAFAGARNNYKKYDFRLIEIAPIIETVLNDSAAIFEEKDFMVETAIAPHLPLISADSNAIRHALQNLVSNAVKYSNGNRWLSVSAKTENGQILISVCDKGIGVDARERKQIFEPFFRGQAAVAAQIHGNGLGLSLVKQIITAHNGKITIESEPHTGSRFTIELPTANES